LNPEGIDNLFVAIVGSAGPSGNNGPRGSFGTPNDFYSKQSWKRDTVLIVILADKIDAGAFPHLENHLSNEDVREATTIIKTMNKKTRVEFKERAEDTINAQNSCVNHIDSFTRFMDRFKSGLTPEDDQDDSDNLPNGLDERNRGRRGTLDHESLFGKGKETQNNRNDRRDNNQDNTYRKESSNRRRSDKNKSARQDAYRGNQGGDPDDSFDSSEDGSYRGSHRGSHRGNRDRRYHHGSTNQRNDHGDSYQGGTFGGTRRLRVDDIGTFDGSPSGTTAVAYCRRLTFLATTYGEQPVLTTLPLCIRDKALNWFSGLNEDVTTLMAESLEE
jgi:hypothetical protein